MPLRATTHDALIEHWAVTLRKISSGKSSRARVRGRRALFHAGDEGIRVLVEALTSPSGPLSLTTLDISGNGVTAHGAQALVPLLSATKQQMQELQLANNRLRDAGTTAVAEADEPADTAEGAAEWATAEPEEDEYTQYRNFRLGPPRGRAG